MKGPDSNTLFLFGEARSFQLTQVVFGPKHGLARLVLVFEVEDRLDRLFVQEVVEIDRREVEVSEQFVGYSAVPPRGEENLNRQVGIEAGRNQGNAFRIAEDPFDCAAGVVDSAWDSQFATKLNEAELRIDEQKHDFGLIFIERLEAKTSFEAGAVSGIGIGVTKGANNGGFVERGCFHDFSPL